MWDWSLRILGCLIPLVFHLLAPDSMVGGTIALWFITMGFVAGIFLRSWWSPLIVASLTLALWLAQALFTSDDMQAGDSDFNLIVAVIVTSGVLILIAGSALLGSWVGRTIERRVRNSAWHSDEI